MSIAQNECLPTEGQPSCFYKKNPDRNHKKLIVFVHGLFGNTANSWGDHQVGMFWSEMVRTDTRFAGSDIYFINYHTPHLSKAPSIHEIGVNELGRMKSMRIFEQYQEIYFLAHSMGGLVTKSILVQLSQGKDVARLRQIKAVVFLGTPAQGSDLAKLGAWFSMNVQIRNLEAAHFNTYLQSLEDQWVQLIEDRDSSSGFFPRAHCAYETLATGVSIVVPREMATSRCDGPLQPMPLNHSGLATPHGKENDPYLWAMAKLEETSTIASQEGELPTLEKSKSEDEIIHMDCQFGLLPIAMPAEGRIYVLDTFPTYGPGAGLIEYFGPPGNEMFWNINGRASTGYRCQITNYGKAPIFNVLMVFKLSFSEVVRLKDHPNSLQSGKRSHSQERLVKVNKIDQAHTNPFVFYIHNRGHQFVDISLPQSAEVQKDAAKKKIIIPVIQPDADMMLAPILSEDK